MAESPTLALPVRERSAAAPPPTSIEDLPNELLSHIFTFLDGPAAPSDARLHDQPSTRLFGPAAGDLPPPQQQRALPLKSASAVSRRWRAVSLPVLFRHVVWPVDRWELLLVEQEPDHVAAVPLLDFIRTHGVGPSVLTLTMVVGDSLAGMHRLQAEDVIDRAQEPRRQRQQQQQQRQGDDGGGGSQDQEGGSNSSRRISLMAAPRMVDDEPGLERSATYNEDNNWLWDAVFGLVDPLRFTLVALPRMLASLLSRMVFLGDAWSFGASPHMLSLSRTRRGGWSLKGKEKEKEKEKEKDATHPEHHKQPSSSSGPPRQGLRRVPCRLFTVRAWTSLLLNEGSSARVYSAREFYTKRPPSILGALLGAEEFPNDERLIPASVRGLSYVAVFPLSGHFSTLVRHLPPVDRLFVQIVPRGDDDVFGDVLASQRRRGRSVDPQDLWIERNAAYSMVIRAMMDGRRRGGWRRLLEFESGDAADREAWELAVQYVRMAGRAWRVAGDGVFCRREGYDEGDDGDDDDEDRDDDDDGGDDDDDDGDDDDYQGGFGGMLPLIGEDGPDDDEDDDDNESVVEIIEMHGGGGGGSGGGAGGSGNGFAGPAHQGDEQESDDDGEHDASVAGSPFLSGRLRRIAFNGTKRLPVSSRYFYSV
ncbi:hypothetical protein RB595_004920 [Gaeumannomyces hyphopodioides]